MTSQTAALAPPPPLANLSGETSQVAAFEVGAPPGEGFSAAGGNDADDAEGASTGDLNNASAQVADAAGSDVAAKPEKMKDFIGQVNDMAFGPNHENTGFNFAAYQETLINNKVLPEFALDEGDQRPATVPKLYADAGMAKAKHSIFDLQMRYFNLKEQV